MLDTQLLGKWNINYNFTKLFSFVWLDQLIQCLGIDASFMLRKKVSKQATQIFFPVVCIKLKGNKYIFVFTWVIILKLQGLI